MFYGIRYHVLYVWIFSSPMQQLKESACALSNNSEMQKKSVALSSVGHCQGQVKDWRTFLLQF